jgi:TP901 family phage tail tape measure protein
VANTIKRTVNISYQAEGLEKIQEQAKKIELFSGESQTIENLFKRIQSLQANLAKQAPEGVVSPELATEFGKEYQAIIAEFKKARLELIAIEDKETAKSLERLDIEIERVERQIELKEKAIEKANKQIVQTDSGELQAGTKTLRKEVLTEAKSTAIGPDEEMRGLSGRDMTNVVSFIESLEKAEEILGNIDKQYIPIVQKIKEGKELNEKEVELLNKAKAENKEIGLDAQELVTAFEQRKKILTEEQNILRQKRAESLAELDLSKKQLENELQIAEAKRDQTESTLADPDLADDINKLEVLNSAFETATGLQAEYKQEVDKSRKSQQAKTASTKESTKAVKENTSTLARATKQVFNYGIAFTALRRIYRETLRTIRDLDKALTEMAIVTTMNRKETWKLVGTMQALAKETGFTTTEIAKLSTVYFRQGRALNEVIELTRVAAQAARIAGISAGQSADFLTSAINAFQLSADQALAVSDRFAALAAQSASSYEELALGLSKFAAQANIAGISIDFAMGLLAKGVETTREAPETIGTALKTVIARMRELTDLGKTFEDGMDINRVEIALRQVGVALRDSSGQFRDMEQVLTDVGMRFDSLNANQQASVAVSLAGTRQQSRLIAIMSGFDRTLQLVNISQNSAGATMAQHTEFMKGMEAATVGLQNAYQKFITTITDSEIIIGIIQGLSIGIEALANGLEAIGFSGQTALISIIGLAAAFKTYSLLVNNSVLVNKLIYF